MSQLYLCAVGDLGRICNLFTVITVITVLIHIVDTAVFLTGPIEQPNRVQLYSHNTGRDP